MAGYRSSIGFSAGVFVFLLGVLQAIAQPPGGSPPVPGGGPGQPQPGAGGQPSLSTPGLPNTPVLPGAAFPGQPVPQPGRRFHFQIDPKAPVKDLLPTAPKAAAPTGPVLTDDLAKVPEVAFRARPAKVTSDGKLTEEAAHQLAKINHLNAKKRDAFMTALLEGRADLAGMPFLMGDDCRASGERVRYFTEAANTVRQALAGGGNVRATNVQPAPFAPPPTQAAPAPVTNFDLVQNMGVLATVNFIPQTPFWQQFNSLCEQQDAARTRPDKKCAEHVTLARIAALTQMLAAESPEVRLGLVKYLTGVPHVEATKALARMAIYSAEDDIRAAAITAMKVRRDKDYTDILVKGLRYPWPAVAKRSAEAVAKLERADLIPELLAVMESADPRLPEKKERGGKSVALVREVVKVNHHRNCAMCHAPVGSGTPNPSAITAEVAVEGQPLPSPAEGYRQSTRELMVRIDVTYLRPDFSASLHVADAHPWPEEQRFDFLVRERKLTSEEAATYREKLTPRGPGVLSPYHKAAVAALREMTGKDAAPTAEAWRKLLDSRQ
jgi:hypothetical protein